MDARDLDIVRWMYPGGVWSPYGIDPRIRPSEIARQVGIGREALWSRFRRWEREGFFRSVEVIPNIRIFGVHRYRVDFQVPNTSAAVRMLDRVRPLEGVVAGWSAFGDSTTTRGVEVVCIEFVAGTDDDPSVWCRRLLRVSGCSNFDGPFSEQPPEIPRTLTRLDWRLIAGLRTHPWRHLSRLACQLGVTTKTVVRRRDALLDSRVIAYVPHFDWAIHPSATFALFYRDPSDRKGIVDWVERRFEHYLPMNDGGPVLGEGHMGGEFDLGRFVGLRVPARSQAEAQALEVEFSHVPKVTRIYNEVPGPMRFYPEWIDRRLVELLGEIEPTCEGKGRTRRGVTAPEPATGKPTPTPAGRTNAMAGTG